MGLVAQPVFKTGEVVCPTLGRFDSCAAPLLSTCS